ncbi:hypothetical protein DN730_07795 [Marinomonas piezotolerans]|uniref:DUF3429 domain-containing protein n=1 Tax=Marinomonas piezotolerans TaxID=2213058 RepID=A0A370U925_9GAMM|nr:DUF3429 domain-containing protein [Marinomonas piezotolerans]RDL44299.1 hypothetical protein DN730_07795 [Marinomonas piezotolerans]
MRTSSRYLITSLGFLGLLPFIGSLLAYHTGWFHASLTAQKLFISYGAIILSFLGGAIWGQVLEQPFQTKGRLLLICSNLIALVAWVGLLTNQPQLSLLVLLLGYVSLFWVEARWLKMVRTDTSYYPGMRFVLTVSVCSMHLLMLYPRY